MKRKLEYNYTDPLSIEKYGQKMVGMTFQDIINHDTTNALILQEDIIYGITHENKRRKGGLGEIVEERHFHYKANNESGPDFAEAGVELKVSPYKQNHNGSLSAKERLIITMIDYHSVINEHFYTSHLWKKSKLILLVYYLFRQEFQNRLDYQIKYVKLFTPPGKDLLIIEHDFNVIVDKIRHGQAHELSGSDTLYLEAATKASTSLDRRSQPFSDIPAKPRAFAFKTSYMTYVLNTFIIPGKDTYEPIIKKDTNLPFEEYVKNRILQYSGYSIDELCHIFSLRQDRNAKNLSALIVYRILGIRGNHAEEFTKANIVIKTIRLTTEGTIKEHMSFPTFKFKELVQEEWENSRFHAYLSDTRFLFVIFQYDMQGILHLKKCQFWNIPYKDLNTHVYKVWNQTKAVLLSGIKITKRGTRNVNNFPKPTQNPVCHVRPHGRNSNDMYELPTGGFYPKQCFWLNNTYILSQLQL